MARKRRHIQAGCCYHIMLRGNSGQDIFHDQADYVRFCLHLQYACEKHDQHIHAFCLMRNHVHVVIQPQTSDLAAGMHALAFRYAQHYNRRYNRIGYLYQGRYKAVLVQSGMYLRHLVRYVHLNPVRARIVRSPEDYVWSSYRVYVGRQDCTWLERTLVLDAFGRNANDSLNNLMRYTEIDDIEAQNEAIAIRNSLHAGAYGDSVFLEKWLPLLRGDTTRSKIVKKDSSQESIADVVEAVCRSLNISLAEIRSDKRSKKCTLARAVVACLIKKREVSSMKALGEYLSRDPTSLAKLARKNEEDSHVQVILNELTKQLMQDPSESCAQTYA